jgi:hypothetical protein
MMSLAIPKTRRPPYFGLSPFGLSALQAAVAIETNVASAKPIHQKRFISPPEIPTRLLSAKPKAAVNRTLVKGSKFKALLREINPVLDSTLNLKP